MLFSKAVFFVFVFLVRSAVMQGKGLWTGPEASLVVRKWPQPPVCCSLWSEQLEIVCFIKTGAWHGVLASECLAWGRSSRIYAVASVADVMSHYRNHEAKESRMIGLKTSKNYLLSRLEHTRFSLYFQDDLSVFRLKGCGDAEYCLNLSSCLALLGNIWGWAT